MSASRSAVIIPVLLYTGITRGKRLVVLVGQKKAIAIAVRNVSGRRRWSKLKEWLHSDVLTPLASSAARARRELLPRVSLADFAAWALRLTT